MADRRIKKDYSKISSRVNTNLKGLKHTKLIALNGSQEIIDDEEQQQN